MTYNIDVLFTGLDCQPAVNLPGGCFCAISGSGGNHHPAPTPYIPLTQLLEVAAKKGVNRSSASLASSKEFTVWTVSEAGLDLTIAFENRTRPYSFRIFNNGTNNK